MKYFEKRRMAKQAKELLHHAQHARAMREDIASPEALARLASAEAGVAAALAGGDRAQFDVAGEALLGAAHAVSPAKSQSGFRENLEVILVAAAVAMALRTYFIQPFKIPTGSMQPTLFGVIVQPQLAPTWKDRLPFSLVGWTLFGEGYKEVRAKESGPMGVGGELPDGEHFAVRIGSTVHKVRKYMPMRFNAGDFVPRGAVIASGRVTLGDHIFVNKVRYNFSRPHRGDIIVFETKAIKYPMRGDFYIKRLVGLPGERISIDQPYLVADGKRVEDPMPFRRLVSDARYHGYVNQAGLSTPQDVYQIGKDEFLPFGDNTGNSLDGRYFGPVKQDMLVGPAFMIYWPFSERWGRAR